MAVQYLQTCGENKQVRGPTKSNFAMLNLERKIRKPIQCAELHHSKEPTSE